MLLQAGVDINAKDADGWTPVHAAAYWNQEEVLKVLSEHGAKLDAKDKVVRAGLVKIDLDPSLFIFH